MSKSQKNKYATKWKALYKENIAEYHKNFNKEYYKKHKDKINIRSLKRQNLNKGTDSSKYSHLKRGAKHRNIEVKITFEQYSEIIKDRTCYYCDSSFENTWGSSLNRIDSNKGYILNNVRPCCGTCNKIMNNFTKEELKIRVYKIVQRMD